MKFAMFAGAAALAVVLSTPAAADTIYDSLPGVMPVNVPSWGYECCSTSEFGDEISFAGTARDLSSATVLLSDWAKYSTYSGNSAYNSSGWTATLTLNLYSDNGGTIGSLIASRTITPTIEWRPESDGCGGDSNAFTGSDQTCNHGLAQTVTFDFSGVTVPDDVIFGLAFDTQNYGGDPTGVDGPYDSLNFGLVDTAPSVGNDVNTDELFINSTGYGLTTAQAGVFNKDTGWSPYTPGIRFETTATPEPATLALFGTGLAGMFAARRRRKA